MRQSNGPREERHPRGVFTTRYKVRGGVYALIAIDSTGLCRKAIPLSLGVNEERATRWLWQWLDRIDPVPTLVRPERTLPPAPHPCQRDDQVSFALRTFRNSVRHIRRLDDD